MPKKFYNIGYSPLVDKSFGTLRLSAKCLLAKWFLTEKLGTPLQKMFVCLKEAKYGRLTPTNILNRI
jgi:hypothetical protein